MIKPTILNRTMKGVYRHHQTPHTIQYAFTKNAFIKDTILHCNAKGHDNIRHYYNDIEYVYYTDPMIIEAKIISEDELETKWVREVASYNRKIFGFDKITLHKGKVVNVIIQMDEEKTREWNEHLDYGMLSEYVLGPFVQEEN